jgi:hypothetical protein
MNRKQPTAFKTTDNNSTSFDKKRKLRSKVNLQEPILN